MAQVEYEKHLLVTTLASTATSLVIAATTPCDRSHNSGPWDRSQAAAAAASASGSRNHNSGPEGGRFGRRQTETERKAAKSKNSGKNAEECPSGDCHRSTWQCLDTEGLVLC